MLLLSSLCACNVFLYKIWRISIYARHSSGGRTQDIGIRKEEDYRKEIPPPRSAERGSELITTAQRARV